MTDPDERTINRAISLLGTAAAAIEEWVAEDREEARAALHRLFRDRRRLEDGLAELREAVRYELEHPGRARGRLRQLIEETK